MHEHEEAKFLAAQFAPPLERDKLLAVLAFSIEVTRIPMLVREAPLGAIRQQWWREALAEVYAGGLVRTHPVVEALAVAVGAERAGVLQEYFEQIITGVDFFLEKKVLKNAVHLQKVMRQSRGAIALLGAGCLNVTYLEDPEKREALVAIEALCSLASRFKGVDSLAYTGEAALLASARQGQEPMLAADMRQSFLALRPVLRNLPSGLMPIVATLCLVPRWMQGMQPEQVKRLGPFEMRLRLVATVLTGRC